MLGRAEAVNLTYRQAAIAHQTGSRARELRSVSLPAYPVEEVSPSRNPNPAVWLGLGNPAPSPAPAIMAGDSNSLSEETV